MDNIALITGGTRGIGLGIARQLVMNGFHLAINGQRKDSEIKQILNELQNTGKNVIYCRGNIGIKADRVKIINQFRDKFDHINLLVNNAGMAPRIRQDLLEATEESFEEIIRTNLQGPYFLTQEIAKWMIECKQKFNEIKSTIINISSVSSTLASVNRGDYCLSKAGLSMMTQLYAVKLSEYNIPVYEIRPGIIETDMTRAVREKYDKLIKNGLCLQNRWGTPEDIGKAVVMLSQGYLSYSTGQVIMIDGGMTVGRL